MRALRASLLLAPALLLSFAVAAESPFRHPEPVDLLGYSGDAMEPFLSRDGQVLFFNDSNAPGRDTQLHWAEAVDAVTFLYRGELAGSISPALDAVASLASDGTLVFVSSRSYSRTLSTLYWGRWVDERLEGVRLVPGVSRRQPGWVNFDAEISADGRELLFVDGRFGGGPVPGAADLVLARRGEGGFRRHPRSAALLRRVNTAALEYAPATSADGRELFFTRWDRVPRILRAVRWSRSAAFRSAEVIAAIPPSAEAPTISPDGLSLYYHREVGGTFRIERVRRRRAPAPAPPGGP